MTKQEIIAHMLRHYDEAQATLNGPDGIRGDGQSPVEMPDTWTPAYRELERCLILLRADRPTQWWHLRERYMAAQTRRIEVALTPNGRLKLPPHTELHGIQPIIAGRRTTIIVRQWVPAVRLEKVRRALDYLAHHYRGEPSLPPASKDQPNGRAILTIATGTTAPKSRAHLEAKPLEQQAAAPNA